MNDNKLSELVLKLKTIDNISDTEEFDLFYSTTCSIGNLHNPKYIYELVQFLDNTSSEEDLMTAIVRTIEIFNDEIYIKGILNVSSDLYKKSPGWCLLLMVMAVSCCLSAMLIILIRHRSEIFRL